MLITSVLLRSRMRFYILPFGDFFQLCHSAILSSPFYSIQYFLLTQQPEITFDTVYILCSIHHYARVLCGVNIHPSRPQFSVSLSTIVTTVAHQSTPSFPLVSAIIINHFLLLSRLLRIHQHHPSFPGRQREPFPGRRSSTSHVTA